jgi:hypothetical protein
LARLAAGGRARFFLLDQFDHLSILAPLTELIARKIVAEAGQGIPIDLNEDELSQLE